MKNHRLTLILDRPSSEEMADALFEAGCDDPTLSMSGGVTSLDFNREAESLEDAIASAIANVESTGTKVLRVEPDDLVTVTEAG